MLLIIPRFDGLSRAWTAATRSLLPLGNIILVWAVCFVVFAIAFTATLGLVLFPADQTWDEDFRSVPNSLVLLFSLSYGDDWPEVMESAAKVTSSQCGDNHGQCVNAASVRALFMIWNILSMYFFANACTAVVYSNTLAQMSLLSSKEVVNAVSREEIRRFKQAWALLDPEGTGYISKEAFPRLLGVSPKLVKSPSCANGNSQELSGIFEMRIHDAEWSVRRILEQCSANRISRRYPSYGVDLEKLNELLSQLPVQKIRRQRQRMDLFYSEILISADPDRGISIVSVLRILAHYNILKDQTGLL